ncbi:copper transporter [soil metagenome]
MIDFRYHLISIIAVLLALSTGIVIGSGFLGGRLLQEVRSAARRVADRNQTLRLENAEVTDRAEAAEAALEALEPGLLEGALGDRRVVMLEFEGADQAAGQVRAAMERAGGQIVGVIRFQEGLSLEEESTRTEIGALLEVDRRRAGALQQSLADVLGRALNEAEAARDPGDQAGLEDLLTSLEDTGLVVAEDLPVVFPSDTDFVVAGGAVPEPTWPVADFAVTMAERLAEHEGGVVVVEPTQSTWDMAGAVRRNGATEAVVWTVDNSDTVLGRLASVLVLGRAGSRPADHYGTQPGASAVVPGPEP